MRSSRKKVLRFSFWQTMVLVLAVALLAFWGGKLLGTAKPPSFLQRTTVAAIKAEELQKALAKKDFTLINVHTPYEGEIAQTDAFIAYDKIAEEQSKLPADKNAKIILYCQSGQMSSSAVKKLTELGYTNVSHLAGGMGAWQKAGYQTFNIEEIKKSVLPEGGFSAPVKWGDLGPRLVSLGVIDLEKFKKAVNPTPEQLAILEKGTDQLMTINQGNAQFVVDILWALGLAQKSKVYTEGPMGKEYKEKVGNFASTGGWTLAKGPATNYLNRHEIVKLNPEQQNRVFEVAKNVYRPCCGNPTSFPDCNHGMAALGLVELMVAENYSEEEIYRTVLGFNSFWFPQNYMTLAAYYALQGKTWESVDAKEALGQQFSSGQGAAKVSQAIGRLPYLYKAQGGGCGV